MYYLSYFIKYSKQFHGKVLLSSFYLNGHTIGFHPETQKSEPPHAASWHVLHLSTFQSVIQKLSFQWLHFRKLSILLLVWNPQCLLSSYKGKPLSIMSLFLLITGWNWVLWRLVGVQWGLHRDKLQHRRGSLNKDLKRFRLPLTSSFTVRARRAIPRKCHLGLF